ncbi:MAG: N-acetyltransferase [Clostridium sp.]|nr:N-acetyltransferase [Clostridium sp.]
MYLHQNELTIRDALPADAPLLCRWWNDGKVMEHAGFPQGLGTSVEKITQKFLEPDNRTHLLIIESEGLPIGEMNWRREESDHAEIGIKICESDRQEKGFGSRLIAMLCRDLFANRGIARITLNTMLENQRAQHVYEKLGFVKTGVRENCWRDQTGKLRTAVDYQLLPQQLRLPFGEKEPWVRDAVPADRKAIAEIYRTLFEAMSNLQPQYIQAAEQDPDFILKIITESKKDILVAQCGVQLLGFALVLMTHTPPYRCFVPHPYADLLDLAVLPDARGNGLGTLLLQAVKGWAKAYGADYLELDALSNNQGAVRLYEREGFRECMKTFRASL